jgi:hypothetical protein
MENQPVPLWHLLRKKFPVGEYALLPEVRNGAGFSATNSADGIAFNLWPSRGLEIHGIEIKSFRNDWLRECKQPQKAEAIFKYCDRFWLVSENEKVVLDVAEIPATWGYMVRKGDKLRVMKDAPKLTPEPLSRGFIAAMFKRATEGLILPSEIEDKIKSAVEKDKLYRVNAAHQLEQSLLELQKKVSDFETAAGIKINEGWMYKSENIGKAVRFYLNGGYEHYESRMKVLQDTATGLAASITAQLEEYQKTKNQQP